MNSYPQPILRARTPPSLSRSVRRAGRALLRILSILVLLVLAVPVAILPAGTAVPAPVWVLLAIADIALMVALVRVARTWRAA